MSVLGKGTDCFVLPFPATDRITNTVPRVSKITWLTDSRAPSYQLVTDDTPREFVTTNTDTATAGTKTFVMANSAFVAGDVGGRIIIKGSVSNDGVRTIATRTNGTTITTTEAMTDETFAAGVSVIVVPPGTLDGAWLIEASNDYSGAGGNNGQPPTNGIEHWTDITALFKQPSGSAIAAVAHGTAATRNQFAQAPPLAARVIRATFTATAGAGRALAIIGGGSY